MRMAQAIENARKYAHASRLYVAGMSEYAYGSRLYTDAMSELRRKYHESTGKYASSLTELWDWVNYWEANEKRIAENNKQ